MNQTVEQKLSENYFIKLKGRAGMISRASSSIASQWQTVATKYPDEFDIPKYDVNIEECDCVQQTVQT